MSTNPNTITGQINLYIFDLLTEHPEGIQWSDLIRRVEQKFPDFHTKTINGCIWKLTEKFPDQIYKPQKGLFKLKV